MLLVTFKYTNGTTATKEFVSTQELYWFAHNEGDHLVSWEVDETSTTPSTLPPNGGKSGASSPVDQGSRA